MAELPERDQALLLDMLLAARDAREFLSGMGKEQFLAAKLHQNAVIRSLEVIGETAGQISRTSTNAIPKVPWRKVTGMRHRLIHDYFDSKIRPHPAVACLQAIIHERRSRKTSRLEAETP